MRWKAFFPVLIGFCLAVVFAAEGFGAEDVQGMRTEREQGMLTEREQGMLTEHEQGMLTEHEQGMRTEHSGASAKEKPLLLTERVQQMRAERVHQQVAAEETESAEGTGSTEAEEISRPYRLNANFKVVADTLWLYHLPLTDSLAVVQGDQLVVAEFAVHPDDSIYSLWVKVARDQETIGWLPEQRLLQGIVPVDPISQGILWFSSSHTVPFLVISAGFALWFAVRAVRRKQIRLIGLNDIDSIFPLSLSWLMAVAATLYNSILHFSPSVWEAYYYNPSLNPFQLPFIIGLFIFCIWLIILMGIAMLDDLFHQTSVEVALFYLTGVAACCIFLYIFLTCLPVYGAYFCLTAYSVWVFKQLKGASGYPYACGACGAKMRRKGICPHCGAMNE